MASRRKLKQTIQFVSSELISEIYFRCLMLKNVQSEKVEVLITEITALATEFSLRANRPDGKANPKLVKAYYAKLYSDWQAAMDKVLKSIELL
jgi:hypothetical protein